MRRSVKINTLEVDIMVGRKEKINNLSHDELFELLSRVTILKAKRLKSGHWQVLSYSFNFKEI